MLLFACLSVHADIFNIKDFGAVGDGKTLNTKFIQAAIDAATAKGGGQVVVPQNESFVSGTIHLKSHVDFHLEAGAVLLGSTNWLDYEKNNRWFALILGKDAEQVSITGAGTIDGQGLKLVDDILQKIKSKVITKASLHKPESGSSGNPISRNRPNESIRPQLIEFLNCTGTTIKDITLTNGSGWTETYIECQRMIFEEIKVRAFAYWTTDGLDLVDCKDVVVKNCDIQCEDDGICLKSYNPASFCENISVSNCLISSGSSAFKLGTASFGGFRNITVRDLFIHDSFRSAIGVMVVDGGFCENVDIANVTVTNTGGSIFIRLGNRSPKAPPGRIDGIKLSNITMSVRADGQNVNPYRIKRDSPPPSEKLPPYNSFPATIVGLPGYPVKNVVMDNVRINFFGGGKKKIAHIPLDALSTIPEMEKAYPEIQIFGELPASAFYLRHVKNIGFKNLVINFVKPDYRPAFVVDDADQIILEDITVQTVTNLPLVVLNNSRSDEIKKITTSLNGENLVKRQ